jgi:hypothetical protein
MGQGGPKAHGRLHGLSIGVPSPPVPGCGFPVPAFHPFHRCPSPISGLRKAPRRIPTFPIGYTKVYNRRCQNRSAGCKTVSSSDQKRVKSVKTGSSFVLPILPNDPQNRIGASAKGVLGLARRKKWPFSPSGIYYSVAQHFCTKAYKIRDVPSGSPFPVPRSLFPPVFSCAAWALSLAHGSGRIPDFCRRVRNGHRPF